MTPTNDARELQAESRPLMTATALAQQKLETAAAKVLQVEGVLKDISAAAARKQQEVSAQLQKLERERETLLAKQSLGTDATSEIHEVDQQVAELRSKQTTSRDLTQARVGLQRELALANIALADASKSERKARLALIALLEQQKSAAWQLIDEQWIKFAVTIQALAQLRGALGLDGLEQNGITMPRASVLPDTAVMRLNSSALEARVSEEVRHIASSLEKRGILVAPAAIAKLQSPSTKPYEVVEPLRRNGQDYATGDPITLPDVDARPLLESRTIVERAATTTREPERQAA